MKSRITKSEHNGKGARAARLQRNKMVCLPNLLHGTVIIILHFFIKEFLVYFLLCSYEIKNEQLLWKRKGPPVDQQVLPVSLWDFFFWCNCFSIDWMYWNMFDFIVLTHLITGSFWAFRWCEPKFTCRRYFVIIIYRNFFGSVFHCRFFWVQAENNGTTILCSECIFKFRFRKYWV